MVPHHDPTQQPDFPTDAPARPDDTPPPAPPSQTTPAARTTVRPLPVPSTLVLRLLGPDHPGNQPNLPAAWTPGPSAVLDWLALIDQDLRTLDTHLRQLRRAVEEVLP